MEVAGLETCWLQRTNEDTHKKTVLGFLLLPPADTVFPFTFEVLKFERRERKTRNEEVEESKPNFVRERKGRAVCGCHGEKRR